MSRLKAVARWCALIGLIISTICNVVVMLLTSQWLAGWLLAAVSMGLACWLAPHDKGKE